MNRNSKITVGLLCLLVSTFGGGAWKIAQTVAKADEQAQKIQRLENSFDKLNESTTRMSNDIAFIRGYFERIERKR